MGWITEDRSENIVSKDQPVGIDHVLDHLHLEHAIGSRWGGRETGRGASPSE